MKDDKYKVAYTQLKQVIENKAKEFQSLVDSYGEMNIPSDVLARYYEFAHLNRTICEIEDDIINAE